MVKHDDSMLKCSFCGKSQDQVKKLIAGPEVYICDECVELCNQILDEEFFENKDKDSITGEKFNTFITNIYLRSCNKLLNLILRFSAK